MMEMKDRIRLLMDTMQMNQQDFAKMLDMSAGSLSSIFSGRTRPTNNHTQAIHAAFPNVNINWLLFGEGDMYIINEGGLPANDAAGGVAGGDADGNGTLFDGAQTGETAFSGGNNCFSQGNSGSMPGNNGSQQGKSGLLQGNSGSIPGKNGAMQGKNVLSQGSNGSLQGGNGGNMPAGGFGPVFAPSDGGLLWQDVAGKCPNVAYIRRQVKEIRVFYDDGTYESFVSSEAKK